ncbi:MAG: peptidoglycan-binding protein [Phycisphaerales bacterium]
MTRLQGSVGQGGVNLASDVLIVQQLLNRHDLAPLALVAEDGRAGPMVVEAIRHFQARHANMSSPDGRVDPEGRTWRALRNAGQSRGTGSSAETRKADREERARIVDPRVKETERTTRIIDALIPHLSGIRAKIISGYLSDADLYWKVNYHWELLLQTVEHSIGLPIEPGVRGALQGIRGQLLGCRPDPASGYVTGDVGRPTDKSSQQDALQRHKTVSQCKREFKKIMEREGLMRLSKKSPQVFHLAAAPVAAPGTSKHSTGYAIDIQGDNGAIKNVCKSRGATLVFDEKSHVHVEFANA